MIKVKKIRIHLTKAKIVKCKQNLGTLRFIWNKYLEKTTNEYALTGHFIFGYDFAKFHMPKLCEEYPWIKDCPSKARKDMIMQLDKSLRSYFNGTRDFPKYKSKKDKVSSFFFIKNGIRFTNDNCDRIWLPTIGIVKLKEVGYLVQEDIPFITSGRLVQQDDEYYVCFNLKLPDDIHHYKREELNDGMGIDVGVKDYATIYHNGEYVHIPHVNDISSNIKLCESKIKVLQRIISHKIVINLKKYGYKIGDKIKKGKATEIYQTHAIIKLRKRIRKLEARITRIRKEFIRKLCLSLVIAKPRYITIEDLDIQQMLENSSHKLADKIQSSLLYYFRIHLLAKCEEYGITLRLAKRFFASTKTCCKCGHKKRKMFLSTRIYECKKCGNVIDRDENASNNLYRLEDYKIAY